MMKSWLKGSMEEEKQQMETQRQMEQGMQNSVHSQCVNHKNFVSAIEQLDAVIRRQGQVLQQLLLQQGVEAVKVEKIDLEGEDFVYTYPEVELRSVKKEKK